jgi:hypothetical protein
MVFTFEGNVVSQHVGQIVHFGGEYPFCAGRIIE